MKLSRLVVLCALFAQVCVAFAQKLPMTHDVYDSWKTIRQQTLSNDGKWLAYVVAPAVGDGEATVISLDGLRKYTIERGTSLSFSEDNKFVYATVVPAKADVDKAKKEKKKPEDQPKNKLALLDLATGKVTEIEKLRSIRVPDKDKGWFSYQVEAKPATETKPPTPAAAEKPQESKKKKTHTLGSELTLREFVTGKEITMQDVAADYVWSQDGTQLLYSISAKDGKGDGVYILEPATGKKTTIVAGIANYKRLTIDEGGKQVAFMSDAETYEKDEPELAIRLWTAKGGLKTIATNASKALPDGWTIVERGSLSFSKSGKRLFFATAPKPKPAPKDETPDDEKVSVDVWNWQDPLLQPMQLLQAASERNKSYSAMIDIGSGKVMQLETTDLPSVSVGNERDGRYALCLNSLPYRKEISWDDTYSDVYVLDLQSGNRKLLMKHSGGGVSMSVGGKYILWHDKDNGWTSYACDSGATKQISKGTKVSFLNETHDSPSAPPTYGVAGWTKNDDAVWVYDRFDIWSLDPDGRRAPENLTIDGRDRNTRYRVLRMDPEVTTVG